MWTPSFQDYRERELRRTGATNLSFDLERAQMHRTRVSGFAVHVAKLFFRLQYVLALLADRLVISLVPVLFQVKGVEPNYVFLK